MTAEQELVRCVRAAKVKFKSSDLNLELTIEDWLKELLVELIRVGEGFSGKRPFGNSAWKHDPQKALIQAGLLKGHVDEDGYIQDVDEPIEPILLGIIKMWRV